MTGKISKYPSYLFTRFCSKIPTPRVPTIFQKCQGAGWNLEASSEQLLMRKYFHGSPIIKKEIFV